MRKLVMGCTVAGLIALSPKSEARLPASPVPLPGTFQILPQSQIGIASWYGSERQGKPTASGELFDMNKLTGAHRILPLGSMVRVTNLNNLESTIIKINDRGPGIPGRLIDVSWAAAKQLRFVGAGLTPVEVEVVSYPLSYLRQTAGQRIPKSN